MMDPIQVRAAALDKAFSKYSYEGNIPSEEQIIATAATFEDYITNGAPVVEEPVEAPAEEPSV